MLFTPPGPTRDHRPALSQFPQPHIHLCIGYMRINGGRQWARMPSEALGDV